MIPEKLKLMFTCDPIKVRGRDGRRYTIRHPMNQKLCRVPVEDFNKAAGLWESPAKWRVRERKLSRIEHLSDRIYAQNQMALEDGRNFRGVMRAYVEHMKLIYGPQGLFPEVTWRFHEKMVSVWVRRFLTLKSRVVVIDRI